MTDKKDGPGKGAEQPGKRPFATIDVKATEVKTDEAKARQPSGAPSGGAPEQASAATIAAAAKAVSDAQRTSVPVAGAAAPKSADPKPADPKPADAKAGDRKPTSTWSVETALGDRDAPKSALPLTAQANQRGIRRFLSHAVAGVLGGALALLGGQQMLPMLGLDAGRGTAPATASLPPDVAGRIAGLEKTVRERLATPAADAGDAIKESNARIAELTRQATTLAEAQKKLALENAALKDALAQRPAGAADAEKLTRLEEQLAQMVAAAAADPQRAGRLPQIAGLVGQVRDLETAVNNRLGTLRKDLGQEIDNRIAATAEAGETAKSGTVRLDREVTGLKSEAARLTQRVEQLKTSADKLEEALKSLRDEAGSMKTSLEAVDGRAKAAAKPADVAQAVAPVAQKITQIEQSLAGIVRAEDDRKSNAERIVLSLELGNLKRAMDRGVSYRPELAEVRRVAGDRVDLKALERFQAEGVPTLVTLAKEFEKVANQVVDAAAEQPGASVVDRMLASAKTIVRVRRSEYAADDASAEAVVTRMEAALRDGKLADVLAESKKLGDKARAPSADWLRKVEARQTVDAALVAIERALKDSLGAGGATRSEAPKGTKQ